MTGLQVIQLVLLAIVLVPLAAFIVLQTVRAYYGIHRDWTADAVSKELAGLLSQVRELLAVTKEHGAINEAQQRQIASVLGDLSKVASRVHEKQGEIVQKVEEVKVAAEQLTQTTDGKSENAR